MQTRALDNATVLQLASLALLLIAELLLLGLAFDGQALDRQGGWQSAWIARARTLPQILLAAVGAILVLFPLAIKAAAERLGAAHVQRPHKLSFVAIHIFTFSALFWLSDLVFNGLASGATAAAWAATAALTLLTWLCALAPIRFWRSETVGQRRFVAVGLGVGAVAWFVGQGTAKLWDPLAASTFRLTSAVLELFYPHVSADPATRLIRADDFSVVIAPECSGLEGVGLFLVFLTAYLWFFRDRHRFPASFLLFPIGAGIVWLANAARIAALVVVGAEISPAVAAQGFHSQAGWISFIGVALGVVWAAGRSSFLRAAKPPRPMEGSVRGTTPAYLVPLLALLCTAMATGAFSAGIDWLYPVRVFIGVIPLWFFRESYRRFAIRPSWESIGVGVVVFLVWIALEPANEGGGSALHAGLAQMGKGPASVWICFRLIGSVLLVPIAEELAFRGYLIRRLTAADFESVGFTPVAVLPAAASSIAFGLLHGRWLAGTIAGLAYAFLLHRRGELSDPIAAHMTTNALIAIAVLGAGEWQLWL